MGYWNNYFDGLLRHDPRAQALQILCAISLWSPTTDVQPRPAGRRGRQSVRRATVIGYRTRLLVYPFLQKYFVKGVMLGSIKE